MTISKSRPPQGSYDANYDPRPKTVTIGVSLVSIEEHTFEQDGRAVTCPCDDAICYITVDRELIEVKNESCIKYSTIARLVEEQEGLRRTHWKVMSCWECVPDHIADEIF
ncbi:MAG: hypothetical protein AAGE84_17135 [Cyanobacteria bacterium P01_G01_bin.39]